MPLTPFINQPFDAPVWRMEIDESTDTLFVELRDTSNKQVSFAAIDLNTGNTNFKDLIMPERWLSSIETAGNGVLLLHGYQSESTPIHKGLTGVNSITGKVLWTDYNINFELLNRQGIIVYDARIQPKKLYAIDTYTGQRKGAYEPADTGIDSSIAFPQVIQADDLPPGLSNLQPYGNVVHYLKHNNFRIVSLHALDGSHLTQHLYLFDRNNELIFDDIMNNDIQKLQPEAFISYKNKLIWLKNRSVVKVLNL
ncbi:DUF4905 domain-containing protein [Mucilaginibacter polytrichastri]|uniref:DUF4905 domain-containing protein n=1 Tax=Mucilaginibacter polytrichastri TaxID=1302689 RepID=A0A1Q5ZXR0_9SPHI|nr:DUF4905 domain-containing protein [Mucilaginibacter polytrichastri]OKS86543.1 hypothetical protein RG47T_1999 [Mucilaginibacter polytrichastri]SFS79788.1 protein of unknown function [Mucilaginibacter polytrichastri]